VATQQIPIGIVLPRLASYQHLVHALATAPFVTETEFTFGTPLYKATKAICERLLETKTALEKFDAYFEHGILDEEQRVLLAQVFRQRYLRANPRSEGSDVFNASGEVMQFSFILHQPANLEGSEAAIAVAESLPHDRAVMESLKRGQGIGRDHLKGTLKLFLDHVYNPRRRDLPAVREVMTGPRQYEPVVVELMTNGALPGLFGHLLAPLVHPLEGALVMLPG
jgi:hypothetical protein